MSWVKIKNPSKQLLDTLLAKRVKEAGPCHDCGAQIGEPHTDGCDCERCTVCGGQRLSCDCNYRDKKYVHEIWTGLWTGITECYRLGLVCKWGEDGEPTFDLNAEALLKITKKKKGRKYA